MNRQQTLWLSGALALILSSCAATEINHWQGLDTDLKPAAQPLDCTWPRPSEVVGDSIMYDNAGINDLDDYKECSEANQGIASEHAAQIGQLKIARKGLTEAGQAQKAIADMRETMLNDERKHNFFEKIGLWVLVAVLGVAVSD